MSKSNSENEISFTNDILSIPCQKQEIKTIPSRSVRVSKIIEAFQLETNSFKEEIKSQINMFKRDLMYEYHKSKSSNGLKPGDIDSLLLNEHTESFSIINHETKDVICLDRLEKNGSKFDHPTITEIIKKQCEILMAAKFRSFSEQDDSTLLGNKKNN